MFNVPERYDLTPQEAAEVDAYMNSPAHRAWERRVFAKIAKQRGLPSSLERYRAAQKERRTALDNDISGRRRAAKIKRTPAWADAKAIRAIYREARTLTKSTGHPHHVDHVYPLLGQLVSGLHVENNLQILPGLENMRKGNRFEVEP